MYYLPKAAQPAVLRETDIRLPDEISITWRLHTSASLIPTPLPITEPILRPGLIMSMTFMLGIESDKDGRVFVCLSRAIRALAEQGIRIRGKRCKIYF